MEKLEIPGYEEIGMKDRIAGGNENLISVTTWSPEMTLRYFRKINDELKFPDPESEEGDPSRVNELFPKDMICDQCDKPVNSEYHINDECVNLNEDQKDEEAFPGFDDEPDELPTNNAKERNKELAEDRGKTEEESP